MTENEFKVFSFVKSHPDAADHFISGKIEGFDQSRVLAIIDSLEDRGLIYKTTPDWSSYTANNWNDISFPEQIDHALMVITRWKKHTCAKDLVSEFNNELPASDIEAIIEYLIQNKAGLAMGAKEGTYLGYTTQTVLAYKQKEYLKGQHSPPSYQGRRVWSADDFKRNVLVFLDDHGDTFANITNVLLSSGIEQFNMKYLLDELKRDGLIELHADNPHLNLKSYELGPNANFRLRITVKGREYVSHHFSPARAAVSYNIVNSGSMTGVFAQGSTVQENRVSKKIYGIPKPESFLSKILWYIIVPFSLMVLIYYLGMN